MLVGVGDLVGPGVSVTQGIGDALAVMVTPCSVDAFGTASPPAGVSGVMVGVAEGQTGNVSGSAVLSITTVDTTVDGITADGNAVGLDPTAVAITNVADAGIVLVGEGVIVGVAVRLGVADGVHVFDGVNVWRGVAVISPRRVAVALGTSVEIVVAVAEVVTVSVLFIVRVGLTAAVAATTSFDVGVIGTGVTVTLFTAVLFTAV